MRLIRHCPRLYVQKLKTFSRFLSNSLLTFYTLFYLFYLQVLLDVFEETIVSKAVKLLKRMLLHTTFLTNTLSSVAAIVNPLILKVVSGFPNILFNTKFIR